MSESDFAFQKKVGISESYPQNVNAIMDSFLRLYYCMKETNQKHGLTCESFRLDFRPVSYDEQILQEFPMGCYVLDLKFGSKKELEEVKGKK